MFTYKLRDSAGAWQGVAREKGGVRFTPSNVCDFMAHNYYRGETLLMELKSTQAKSMAFTNLKKNQIIGLYNASQYKGTSCYFIFNFRTLEETYAIDARLIKEYWETSDRKSFPLDWIRNVGTFIPQQKKRTHFKFEIDRLLN